MKDSYRLHCPCPARSGSKLERYGVGNFPSCITQLLTSSTVLSAPIFVQLIIISGETAPCHFLDGISQNSFHPDEGLIAERVFTHAYSHSGEKVVPPRRAEPSSVKVTTFTMHFPPRYVETSPR